MTLKQLFILYELTKCASFGLIRYKFQARKELEELEGLKGLEGLEVKRYAVEHFVVGRFTVVIVEQPTQAASAAVSQIA